MQYSHAQDVADGFVAFLRFPQEESTLLQNVESLEDQLRKLDCLSDWLQLWLDSGEAYRYCGTNFGLYMHAVAIVFAERFLNPGLLKELDVVPTATAEGDGEFITNQEYVLPASMTIDGFMASSSFTNKQRKWAIQYLLENAKRARYGK